MYKLRDFLTGPVGLAPEQIHSDEFYCGQTDIRRTALVNLMQETYGGFSYILVNEGELRLLYNNSEVTLHPHDIFIYSPGAHYHIVAGSDDYKAICLICDESLTLDTPVVRNLVRTAFYPIAAFGQPVVHLTDEQFLHFWRFMQVITSYLNYPHRFHQETLRTIYSLFLLDLLDVMEQNIGQHRVNEYSAEVFIAFMKLLPRHFVEHHDIGFYASKLCITTTHLSRVVRQITGRTVMDYIDGMLMMEASWLLRNTDMSVAGIAEKLHFSSQSSFSKFFARRKGRSPREYRTIL